MTLADRPGAWPVESSTDLHRDSWEVALRSDQVHRPGHEDQPSFRRLVLEHPGAVVVLAIDAEGRVLCLKQYRHPVLSTLVELPAGLCDVPDEDPRAVAARELREEAGLQASQWTHLLTTYSSPGISAERIHYWVAEGLSEVDRGDFVPEHEEAEMETLWVPFDELRDAVLDGRVASGPVVQAVLAFVVRRLSDRA